MIARQGTSIECTQYITADPFAAAQHLRPSDRSVNHGCAEVSAPFPTPRLPAARDTPKQRCRLYFSPNTSACCWNAGRGADPRVRGKTQTSVRGPRCLRCPPRRYSIPDPEWLASNLCTQNVQAIKIPRGGPMKHRPRRWDFNSATCLLLFLWPRGEQPLGGGHARTTPRWPGE